MTTTELLHELLSRNVKIWVDDGQLKIQAPKDVLTMQLRDSLAKYKEQLITLINKNNRPSGSILPRIEPEPELLNQPFPQTDVQQAYWIGREGGFMLGNIATHVYQEYDCIDLDIERLSAAFQKLIHRHPMLRCVMLANGEQKVLDSVPAYTIEVQDLTALTEEQAEAEMLRLRDQMSHTVKPSDHWPLFEIRASRCPDQKTRLHISLDMLILDFSSILLIFSEWMRMYQNIDARWAPLEVSFRDYVLAEQSLRRTKLHDQAREYWFNRLPTLPPGPELPLRADPATIASPRFVRRTDTLSPAQWQKLKERAKRAGLTPSALLLTAYSEILILWSKTSSFTINLTLSNRLPVHPQINEIAGDFSSVTLLEINRDLEATFQEQAQKVQDQLWQDLNYATFSGIQVLRELARRQGGAHRTFMPVVFTSAIGVDTLKVNSRENDFFGTEIFGISQTPQVWLDHQVYERGGHLVLNWDAVEDLFPQEMLDHMFQSYSELLRILAESAEVWQHKRLVNLPSPQMQRRLDSNSQTRPLSNALLHTLFSEQAAKSALKQAVISCDRTLTYEELFQRANHTGRQLRKGGAQPNALVAVVMEKGWQQIVAVLGILASGAAYLPIDPHLPKERINHLLKDAEVRQILTVADIDKEIEWPADVARLLINDLVPTAEDTKPLNPVQGPDDLAYVIYTSGSTGLPKGVMIDHRGAVNTILDINERFQVTSRDKVLALSHLNFDLSVYDIFGLLAAGGTIVLPETEGTKDPAHWSELMARHGVTIWNSVPALMQMLVEQIKKQSTEIASPIRLVMMSGDWIPVDLPSRIKSLFSEAEIVSLGGATESSIWSIFYPISSVADSWKSIPYGKPLSNQTFAVLNQAMTPCPDWVPGQLYIGGIGLAKGYWNDPSKTAASFITHPHTGERLYRTGDQGRYLPDGNIEFLGREDFQVKVNGLRIELGEIEFALRQHPAVKEAVVSTFEHEEGQRRLVAYVVTGGEKASEDDAGQPKLPELQQIHGNQTEAVAPEELQEVIMDPMERLEFKLRQPGLRQAKDINLAIQLPMPEITEELRRAYLERQSFRTFEETPLSLNQLSDMLAPLMQLRFENAPLPKYRYPSAGSLFPIQVYLYVKPGMVDGLEGGIYYHHPVSHSLVAINEEARIQETIYDGINRRIFENAAFAIFQIAEMEAITPMYGSWSRDFCLLEAGYMGQLLMMTAPKLSIGLCPIGYFRFPEVEDLFNLKESQTLIHSFLGGPVSEQQTRQWSQPEFAPQPNDLSAELIFFVEQKLPDYMIPDDFVFLDALPLSINGKVDRKALPCPHVSAGNNAVSYQAPRTETEKRLASIWAETLNVDRVGLHDNFFRLGGNSLLGVRLNNSTSKSFGIELSVRHLFEKQTIEGLAGVIDGLREMNARPDSLPEDASPAADAHLDPLIVPTAVPLRQPTAQDGILLTGATGFLGTNLLHRLLEDHRGQIHCLVRAENDQHAMNRLKEKMVEAQLWQDKYADRLRPIAGDLTIPLFGLAEQEYVRLADSIGAIFHNGAMVNHVYPYSLLRLTNVQGTEQVIRLACHQRRKTIHFISTTRIFEGINNQATPIAESDQLPDIERIIGGYNQSKWVAEKLLSEARQRGLPVCIYRAGPISGHSQTGVANTDDLFCRMIKGSIQMGKISCQNAAGDMTLDILPVDYVCQAILHLANRQDAIGKVYHLFNSNPLRTSELFNFMVAAGYQMKQVEFPEWLSELSIITPDNALYPYLPVFSEMYGSEGTGSFPALDNRNTVAGLADSELSQWPEIDGAILSSYLSYFWEIGFLPSLSESRAQSS